MLNAIIKFSLHHRAIVLICAVGLLAGGIYSFSRLPIDAVPDITNNQVQILTNAPSLSALEIERFVTFPIELSVKSLPDLVEMRSLSRPGLSVITVVFEEDVDVYFGRQLILEKLREVEADLPEGVETPQLGPVSTGLGEIYRYVVRDTSGKYSPMDLRTMQDWIIRRELLGAEALAEVNSLGGELKQYQVHVDPEKLAGYNLSMRDVFNAATAASDNAGGAYIETGPEQLAVRAVGLATSVADIEQTVIKVDDNGFPVTISQVADVATGSAIRFGSASQDGKGEVVVGIVMQLKGANARVTVQGVKERIEEIKTELPEGVVLEPFYDREILVDRTIKTVLTNLIEGALLVIGILLLFLVSLRAGLVVASIIPLSMCFAGIMMLLTGQSGNLMSLGAIDFGLVVDGSLIIVENVLRMMDRHYRQGTPTPLSADGMKKLVYSGALEVRKAAQFGEIIVIMVYLPIITLQGIEGKLFRPMALTVGFALVGALILSITYVPAMCSLVLRGQKRIRHSPVIEWFRKLYRPTLLWALRQRMLVMGGAAALILAAILGFNTLGGEFIPRLEEGDIAMHLIRLPSVSLTESQQMATRVEQEIMTFPEVLTVVSQTGRAEVSTDPMGFELADVFIMLRPFEEWTTGRSREQLVEALHARLDKMEGFGTQFLQPIEMRMNELIAGARGDVVVKIFGEDYNVLGPAAQKIATIMRSVEGGSDVAAEQVDGLPQLVITPNRSTLSRYGLTVQEINHIIEMAVAGAEAGTVYEGERSFDLVVRLKESARNDVESIGNILVATPTGARVPLRELASLDVVDGPTQVSREQGSRFTSIQANVRGRDVESYVKEVQKNLDAEVQLPAAYRIEYGGQFKNLQQASQQLIIIVPIALFLIFALLFQTFESLRPGLLIFLCIPMSVVGGVAALMLRGMPFSISAGVGFIALSGIAVLNGIVMIAAFRKHQSEGLSLREAILAGADERIRPVVTTAALAGFGFLPMMLSTSAGAEVQRPLATVIIGGIFSATVLTLIVLPVIYNTFGLSKKQTDNTQPTDSEKPTGPGGKGLAISIILAVLCSTAWGTNAFAQTELTREVFLQRVLTNSPSIDQAKATVQRTTAQGSPGNLFPSTNFFYKTDENPTGDLPGGPTVSIGVGQSFAFPTLYVSQGRARDAAVDAAQAAVNTKRQEISKQAVKVWTELVGAHLQLRLVDTMLFKAQQLLKAAQFRREVGDITSLELKKAQIELGKAQRDSIEGWNRYQISLENARALMGASPNEEFMIPNAEIASERISDRASLWERIKQNNPQLHEAELRLQAEEAKIAVEKNRLLPSFGIDFSFQSVENRSGYYGAGAQINLPISQWFYSPGTETARAAVVEQRFAINHIERELAIELEQLLAHYQRADDLLNHYQSSLLPAAREASQIALTLYREGESGYLETLDSQNTLVEIEQDYLQTRIQFEQTVMEIQLLNFEL